MYRYNSPPPPLAVPLCLSHSLPESLSLLVFSYARMAFMCRYKLS